MAKIEKYIVSDISSLSLRINALLKQYDFAIASGKSVAQNKIIKGDREYEII